MVETFEFVKQAKKSEVSDTVIGHLIVFHFLLYRKFGNITFETCFFTVSENFLFTKNQTAFGR